jgi:hypothetical protein
MQFLKHLHGHASGGGEHHGRRTTVYPFDGRNNQRMNWAFCPAQIRTRRTHVDKIREPEEQQDNSQKKKKTTWQCGQNTGDVAARQGWKIR